MGAAPLMAGSYSNPGPRKRPGGTIRAPDSNHMSVNPLKAFNRFVCTRLFSISLFPLHAGPEQGRHGLDRCAPGCTSPGPGPVFTTCRVCIMGLLLRVPSDPPSCRGAVITPESPWIHQHIDLHSNPSDIGF